MPWLFGLIGLVVIVVIGLVVIGGETSRLARSARPAVFDLAEAVLFIADVLPETSQARVSHDDVRWVLLVDADLLEAATAEPGRSGESEAGDDGGLIVGEDEAVANILADAEAQGRDITDEDVAAILEGRMRYLEAIGAVGPAA